MLNALIGSTVIKYEGSGRTQILLEDTEENVKAKKVF